MPRDGLHFEDVAIDTVSLAGPLSAKLQAIAEAGFSQLMLGARDLVGHAQGWQAAVREVRASGLRVAGFRVLRDFEGLQGRLHDYKTGIARSLLEMCAAVRSPVLLACSSTHAHADGDRAAIARDLRKLAIMAIPLRIKIAYEPLSWGRHVNSLLGAWEAITRADCPNLGLSVDSFHALVTATSPEVLQDFDGRQIFMVQLADYLWNELPTPDERMQTGRHMRVFPGQGAHSETLQRLVLALDGIGYRGTYSLGVFNDDYEQLPLPAVAAHARSAALWLAEGVLKRAAPLPGQMRLRRQRRAGAP